MAITCNEAGWITEGKCFVQPTLTAKQQRAIIIFAKAVLVNSYGGTNYTESLSTTLITDSTRAVCGITKPQMDGAEVAIWNSASAAAFSLDQLLTTTNCLQTVDELTLEKADLFLTCKLLAALGL